MAVAMCLVGHIFDNLETYGIYERVLHLTLHEMFQIISGDLSNLEGCYLYYNECKTKWVWRSILSTSDILLKELKTLVQFRVILETI